MKANRFWGSLKNSVAAAKWIQLFVLFLVTFVFPIAEGVLTNLWTAASPETRATPGWCLLIAAALHLVLGVFVLVGKAVCPESVLAEAVEIEEELKTKDDELKRREKGYRLVRATFESLNAQTCAIQATDKPEAWCKGGFEAGLRPIVANLLQNVGTVLGVKATTYSVEVYFYNGCVPPCDPKTESYIGLHFFHGASVARSQAQALIATPCSPVALGFLSPVPYAQHIASNKHLFYEGESPKDSVYFRYFATAHIHPACDSKGETLGILALTSMQDVEFAPDVLDTLRFFASIISNYLYSYGNCYHAQEEAKKKARLTHVAAAAPAANNLPHGFVGKAYSAKLTGNGGVDPQVFSLASGSLPSGLVLAADGAITGTPDKPGRFGFRISAMDAKATRRERPYFLMIANGG